MSDAAIDQWMQLYQRQQAQNDMMLRMRNYMAATQQLGLTPQEQFLYQHHLNNLYGAGKVVYPDGTISTLDQAVVQGPQGYYSIPTIWEGQQLSPDLAAQRAAAVGWDKWPSYPTPEAADARYVGQMHEYLGRDVAAYRQNGESKDIR